MQRQLVPRNEPPAAERTTEAPVPAPFRGHRTRVRPEWVDYNGHMNDAAYAEALGEANEALLLALGLSADYRQRTGASLFTVESHVRYLAECSLGQLLTATTTLLHADPRKLHLCTELFAAEEGGGGAGDGGGPAATGEFLYLHVDSAVGRATPMPPDRQAAVAEVLAAHAALPRPAYVGRGITTSRRTPPLGDGGVTG